MAASSLGKPIIVKGSARKALEWLRKSKNNHPLKEPKVRVKR